MLERIIMAQRDRFRAKRDRLDAAIKRAKRENGNTRQYRRTLALYDELITVIDRHDSERAAAQ